MRAIRVHRGFNRGFSIGRGKFFRFRYFKGKGWRIIISVRTDKWINRLGFNQKVIESKHLTD